LIVTVEENVVQGGFGSAVLESVNQINGKSRILNIGIPDVFVEHGSQKILRRKYGLDTEGIYSRVKQVWSDFKCLQDKMTVTS